MTEKYGYGAMIKQAREAADLSQKDVAQALWQNKDHGRVSRMESELRPVEPEEFGPLCELLHLRRLELIEAMGYRLGLLPKAVRMPDVLGELYDIMSQMPQDERLFVLKVARGVLLDRQGEEKAG